MAAEDTGYFTLNTSEVEVDPTFPPQFVNAEEIPFIEVVEGLRFRPFFGRNMLISLAYFEPNTVAPLHQHAEEQMGLMIEGELEFEIGGITRVIRPGDMYVIPPMVPHTARTYEKGCLAADIFSPPRSGYRELLDRALAEREGGQG